MVALYFAIPYRFRWILLLVASYYFYMCWKVEYAVLIIISTLIDYFAGLKMGGIVEKAKKKKYLILSLCTNLGLLFAFKYFNFFNDSVRNFFNYYNVFYNVRSFNVLLPIGISFYTFQTLSYTIDIYNGKREPEGHLGIFALYVSFFPQLVAGPIERPSRLLPQLYKQNDFDYDRVTNGLKLIGWGLFKKMVIADRLAILVDKVYNSPMQFQGITLVMATVFFAYQIYCDFSGYTDIAVGAAQVMGYELMDNFNRPYFSKSIAEFWRRWHISLSTWFRDYFYIPLGGNRVNKGRWYSNILATFLVSGLWHGANWTFVFWGAIHGLYILFGDLTKGVRNKFVGVLSLNKFPFTYKLFKIVITFSLTCFAWIFFRANDLADALYIVMNLSFDTGKIFILNSLWEGEIVLFGIPGEFILSIALIILLEIVHLIQRKGSIRDMISQKPIWLRWGIYLSIALSIMNFGVIDEIAFIYFQF